jgi:predicted HAD superfamily hydrolase
MKNTYQELELENGEIVKLTLNFARLLKIKSEQPKIYDRFMKVLQNKDFDIVFDSLTVLYTGYLCANMNNESVLSEEEFMELVPFDLEVINVIAGKLIQSSKKK